ncbi:type I polyketide synthase [Streptomyces sp. NPDC047928]|uniref:type I polyketide synthase n=1 Tax=unclassified Streptomyces TaxID=2593676 RepID=UPI0037151679
MTAAAALEAAIDPDGPYLAVVGMACRFPGAADVDEFWDNLRKGRDCVTRYPERESATGGTYVPALGELAGADTFDAAFFGYSPGEALALDPQHRVFMECAWTALEDAGHQPSGGPDVVGVYAGSSQTDYLATLLAHPEATAGMGEWQLRLATGIDMLTTRVAHRFGLTGPAVTVQTACSTSLVAIHVAAQALLAGECDLALAGGVSVHVPPRLGEYTEGGVISPDGYCRPFDARAQGTVAANGVGVVVLKRLGDALADGDHIRAVVRGSAVNNDGLDKVGYTAPSVSGQAAAIRAAQLVADVDPTTVGYVETHGTGTPLGDPIEVAALIRAFTRNPGGGPGAERGPGARDGASAEDGLGTEDGPHTDHGSRTEDGSRRGWCRIGSVKSNIGHADAAAGVAGFIKTVLAVQHGLIPASLHHTADNPGIAFGTGPFVVNTESYEWNPRRHPRRAGVSSFGIGGTNAHIVLEQPPAPAPRTPGPAGTGDQLILVSARSEDRTTASARRVAESLGPRTDVPLADAAWTLQTGRKPFPYRQFAIAGDHATAADELTGPTARVYRAVPGRPVAFLFPGHGGQHVGMGAELYATERVYRERIDLCAELLRPLIGLDLTTLLRPADAGEHAAAESALRRMSIAQPAVFAVEYALAGLWRHWGVVPDAVAGHSLGAYAAACVAGVLSPADALRLVAVRGRLLEGLPDGAMLAVALPEHRVTGLLDDGVEIAAVNGPDQIVASGPRPAIERLRRTLTAAGVEARLLRIQAGAHSALVEDVLEEYAQAVSQARPRPPRVPWISDTTGAEVAPADVASTGFWTGHMRRAVRFGDALNTLLGTPGRVLLEVGPGRTLTTLARRHPARTDEHVLLPSLPHPADDTPARRTVLHAVGRLWAEGVEPDWRRLHEGHAPRKAALPTYPFDRRRHSPVPDTQPEPAPAPERASASASASAADPAPESPADDDTLVRLRELFARALGMDDVGARDNFFEMGGDSLIAVQLAAAVQTSLRVRLSVKQVFTAPTPERLARLVAEERRRDHDGR